MHFAIPLLLLLLILILGLVWYYRKKQSAIYIPMKFPTLEPVKNVQTWREVWAPRLKALRLVALALLIVAFARPQFQRSDKKIDAEVVDIMVVMDISSSMLARDFEPNRLEVAKMLSAEFIDRREYDRIGLAIFAGESFVQCPPTADHRILKDMLGSVQVGLLEDGTAIGMGLKTAVNHLKDSKVKTRLAILLTDGVNNAGEIDPELATQIAQALGVKVYTIGIGSKGEALAPISRREDGEYMFGYVPVEIDEALLTRIATETGGRYYRAADAKALREIYAEIDRLEKTRMDIAIARRDTDEHWQFILPAILLLLIEFFLSHTVFRIFNRT